jgi:hypothetical protein
LLLLLLLLLECYRPCWGICLHPGCQLLLVLLSGLHIQPLQYCCHWLSVPDALESHQPGDNHHHRQLLLLRLKQMVG